MGAGSETCPFYIFILTEKLEFFDTATLDECFDHTGFSYNEELGRNKPTLQVWDTACER